MVGQRREERNRMMKRRVGREAVSVEAAAAAAAAAADVSDLLNLVEDLRAELEGRVFPEGEGDRT